jgi:hypothetical protein
LTLKINILLLLGCIFFSATGYSVDKFLRVKGTIFNEQTQEVLSDYIIKIVEDEGDSSFFEVEKDKFDFWLRDNRLHRVYILKKGYYQKFAEVNAMFMPSFAYEGKLKIELNFKMTPLKRGAVITKIERPIIKVDFIKNQNMFEVKDFTTKKHYMESADYEPPFPSPADTYIKAKPTTKSLALTVSYNRTEARGAAGIPKVIQGILFADMSYCFFNERTNDANKILIKLKEFDPETWESIKEIDSPEYGIIIARTINREQSVDTLFALGQHLETSRLILQNFTSDSKVLVHLIKLRKVLEQFNSSGLSVAEDEFIASMKLLIPNLIKVEDTYKEKLSNKLNFEMANDPDFLKVKEELEKIHTKVIG